jgi:hypothetical protein
VVDEVDEHIFDEHEVDDDEVELLLKIMKQFIIDNIVLLYDNDENDCVMIFLVSRK